MLLLRLTTFRWSLHKPVILRTTTLVYKFLCCSYPSYSVPSLSLSSCSCSTRRSPLSVPGSHSCLPKSLNSYLNLPVSKSLSAIAILPPMCLLGYDIVTPIDILLFNMFMFSLHLRVYHMIEIKHFKISH